MAAVGDATRAPATRRRGPLRDRGGDLGADRTVRLRRADRDGQQRTRTRSPLRGGARSRCHAAAAYRGIGQLTALTIVSEVFDFRRFSTAAAFMGFVGLVPSEYSSGERSRRGWLTKAGNVNVRTALVEAAWRYQHRPAVTVVLKQRHERLDPAVVARAWTAQTRLCARHRRLAQHKPATVVNAAIARELAGFVWAEMTA